MLPQACDDGTGDDDGGGRNRGSISLQFLSGVEDKTELACDAIVRISGARTQPNQRTRTEPLERGDKARTRTRTEPQAEGTRQGSGGL